MFVADVERPEIESHDRHHLERVLRLRPDQILTVADGRGRWRRCHLDGGRLVPAGEVGEVEAEERLTPMLTVAFAPTKGDRPEWAVQKLTELGVDRIVMFLAARSVVRWSGERGQATVQRLARVAREAAMQSRRSWLPEVELAASFGVLAAAGMSDVGVAMADVAGGPPNLAWPTLLVGPEGGWDDSERESGLARVSLGPQVLRTETAAVAAGTLLCALRSGMVGPVEARGAGSTDPVGPSA